MKSMFYGIVKTVVVSMIARRIINIINTKIDLYDIKAVGQELGMPYVPGENIDSYRKRLIEARNNQTGVV